MIFNVNIYRTWKKNRILKIKWNKYSIIQFPQCLLKRFPWKCFCYSFIYSFKFSLSGLTGCVPSPPEKSRQLPPHALHLHYVLYSYIIFANDFLLPHSFTFSSETVSFVRLQHVYVFWYTNKTNPTEFQGKSNTGFVRTCVYVTKSAGKWFWFWRTFKPASSSIWFFLIHLFFLFLSQKGNSYAKYLSQYQLASTLTHKSLLHVEKEKKRKSKSKWGERRMAERRWRAVCGGGAQFNQSSFLISQSQWRKTSAGAFLPHIKRKKEWKARRVSAYEKLWK